MKLLSFDVESNGLHGNGFAVGAVLINANTLEPLSAFRGTSMRKEFIDNLDDWVQENVPVAEIIDNSQPYNSLIELRTAFWIWLQENKKDAIVIADVGYPVEARFLIACQDDNPKQRAWEAPYPLHDVSTLLLAAGVDPDIDRFEYAGELKRKVPLSLMTKHDPYYDAWLSALCAVKALYETKLIRNSVGTQR